MAVADLHETGRRVVRDTGVVVVIVADDPADHLPAGHREDDRAAEPRAVPQELAPRHPARVLPAHGFTTTVARMNGWMVQM